MCAIQAQQQHPAEGQWMDCIAAYCLCHVYNCYMWRKLVAASGAAHTAEQWGRASCLVLLMLVWFMLVNPQLRKSYLPATHYVLGAWCRMAVAYVFPMFMIPVCLVRGCICFKRGSIADKQVGQSADSLCLLAGTLHRQTQKGAGHLAALYDTCTQAPCRGLMLLAEACKQCVCAAVVVLHQDDAGGLLSMLHC